ncbi:hypothetical protein U1Q18_013371 [Sarracenia purpurea var. burkii]
MRAYDDMKCCNTQAAKAREMDYLPLLERLEGWIVEKRHREKSGRYDMYFHHKKSKRTFRSFIAVETYIIDGSSKDKKHKVAIEPWTSGSSEQASSGRQKTPTDREIVEKFLKDAWNNLQNSGTQIEDAGSSIIDHKVQEKETLVEADDKLLSSFRPRKHLKNTSPEDLDEDKLQKIMEELKMIMDGKV